MERESFEDEEVAELLNEHFVSIKVDREERPDIDSIYMSICQMVTGSGGWPLSIFMDADKKPFHSGTYYPKNDRGRYMGFISFLKQIVELWFTDRRRLIKASELILSELKKDNRSNSEVLDFSVIDKASEYFKKQFDLVYGGFGHAPKFPSAHNLLFLMRYNYSTQNSEILNIVEKTLMGMYNGGMYDHIGFGFSRYSTDEKWLVPHFEKMLYDNALLSLAYMEAFHLTGNKAYEKVAEEVYEYVKRDMTSEEGSFYSAEDADSEGVEGKFYVWKPDEILEVLGKENGVKFCKIFDITNKGNFEGDSIPNLIGKTLSPAEIDFSKNCRKKLFEHREKRIHPFKDTKIIVSWNGLMITSLAVAGRVLANNDYTKQAEKCAEHIYNKILQNKNLFADDYAFFAWGLIELYETTFKEKYLSWVIEITDTLLSDFWDKSSAGLFLYGDKSEQLLIRPKEIYDGATPSANSVFAYNLIRLSKMTGNFEYEHKAQKLLDYFSVQIKDIPSAHSFSLISLLYQGLKSIEIVIAAESDEQAADMLRVVASCTNPFTTCLLKTPEHNNITKIAEFTTPHKAIDGKCTAYVCEGLSCHAPITDVEELTKLLQSKNR